MFPKVKVKINEPIAVLADPDKSVLDRKYATIAQRMEDNAAKSNTKLKPGTIIAVINDYKRLDRYDDVPRGFAMDKGFKPGDEVLIPQGVAEKWEALGICSIVEAKRAA